jgi:hypothetical protein
MLRSKASIKICPIKGCLIIMLISLEIMLLPLTLCVIPFFYKTFNHHLPQMSKILNISINVEKSWQFWKSLDNLDKSQQSRLILTILIKISIQPSLDWKISILKISTVKKKSWSQHFKKVRKDNLDLDLDWSWLSRPPTLNIMSS